MKNGISAIQLRREEVRSGQGRRVLQQQNHHMNDYCMLSKAITQQMKSKKNKKKKVYADNYDHCKSMQRLQAISNERNQQITRHIHQKAQLQAKNQELKHINNNPSIREQQLQLRISEQQRQINLLKRKLQEKQETHEIQIQKIKKQHKAEIEMIKSQYQFDRNLEKKYIPVPYSSGNQQIKYATDTTKNYTKIQQPSSKVYGVGSSAYVAGVSTYVPSIQSPAINNPSNFLVVNSTSNPISGRQYISQKEDKDRVSPDNTTKSGSNQTYNDLTSNISYGKNIANVNSLRVSSPSNSYTSARETVTVSPPKENMRRYQSPEQTKFTYKQVTPTVTNTTQPISNESIKMNTYSTSNYSNFKNEIVRTAAPPKTQTNQGYRRVEIKEPVITKVSSNVDLMQDIYQRYGIKD